MATEDDFRKLVSVQVEQTKKLLDTISVEQAKWVKGEEANIAGCFGCAGTFGCFGGCFGCAGTFGCYAEK